MVSFIIPFLAMISAAHAAGRPGGKAKQKTMTVGQSKSIEKAYNQVAQGYNQVVKGYNQVEKGYNQLATTYNRGETTARGIVQHKRPWKP